MADPPPLDPGRINDIVNRLHSLNPHVSSSVDIDDASVRGQLQLAIRDFGDLVRDEGAILQVPHSEVQEFVRLIKDARIWPLAPPVFPELRQDKTVVPRDDHPWTSMEWIVKHTQDRRPAPKYRQGLDQGKEALLSKIEAHMNVLAHGELDPQGSKQEAEKQDAHAKHLTELYRQLQDPEHAGPYSSRPDYNIRPRGEGRNTPQLPLGSTSNAPASPLRVSSPVRSHTRDVSVGGAFEVPLRGTPPGRSASQTSQRASSPRILSPTFQSSGQTGQQTPEQHRRTTSQTSQRASSPRILSPTFQSSGQTGPQTPAQHRRTGSQSSQQLQQSSIPRMISPTLQHSGQTSSPGTTEPHRRTASQTSQQLQQPSSPRTPGQHYQTLSPTLQHLGHTQGSGASEYQRNVSSASPLSPSSRGATPQTPPVKVPTNLPERKKGVNAGNYWVILNAEKNRIGQLRNAHTSWGRDQDLLAYEQKVLSAMQDCFKENMPRRSPFFTPAMHIKQLEDDLKDKEGALEDPELVGGQRLIIESYVEYLKLVIPNFKADWNAAHREMWTRGGQQYKDKATYNFDPNNYGILPGYVQGSPKLWAKIPRYLPHRQGARTEEYWSRIDDAEEGMKQEKAWYEKKNGLFPKLRADFDYYEKLLDDAKATLWIERLPVRNRGVTDRQYRGVLEQELEQIKRKMKERMPDRDVKSLTAYRRYVAEQIRRLA